jgi:hypothetical protein
MNGSPLNYRVLKALRCCTNCLYGQPYKSECRCTRFLCQVNLNGICDDYRSITEEYNREDGNREG